MYGIHANIWGILMVNVTIYGIHRSYGLNPIKILLKFHSNPHQPKKKKDATGPADLPQQLAWRCGHLDKQRLQAVPWEGFCSDPMGFQWNFIVIQWAFHGIL